jgi:sugar-specific transcriptional regulator TrmB
MRERLEALGLNAYEAKAIVHLLRHGPRTGPDLSRETGIPFGRVYDTLNSLVERALVTREGGRPRMFAAVPPSAIPSRLLAAGKRRLQEQERAAAQQAASLETELAKLAPKAAPGSTLYGVRLGEDAARDFLVEATHGSKGMVEACLAFDFIQDEDLAIFDAFRDAVRRGVRTRILLRERDIDYLLGTPYVASVIDALLPHVGESLQVRLTRAEVGAYSVLDGERSVLGVRDVTDPRKYFAVVHIDDPAFAANLRRHFERLWGEAEFDKGLVQRALRRLNEQGLGEKTRGVLEAVVRKRAARAARRAQQAAN